jgi:polyphenol oxidase
MVSAGRRSLLVLQRAADSLNGIEIHGSWWFLAWHRAYLCFHERILGTLIGDPTFALPYWDWDSCHDDPTNPLFDTTRAMGPNDRIPTVTVGPTAMKAIMGAKSFTDFGGSGNEELPAVAGNNPQQMGQLEAGPHGLVHLWTTDPKGFSGLADMGMLASAGFDPVFFAHHANIDRLWIVWAATASHANPANDRWLNQEPFYFYDQKQTWTGILVNQVIDAEKSLSFRYQPPHWPSGTTAAAAVAPPTAVRVAQVEPLSAPIAKPLRGTSAFPCLRTSSQR